MSMPVHLEASAKPLAAVARPAPVRDRDAFWRFAEQAKTATETLAQRRMAALREAPVEVLREVCTQYRFFTLDYIGDLALLIARLPSGRLRSLLARILGEELGEGDPAKAHPAVYDRFLLSIGVAPERLERCLPANRAILDGLTADMTRRGAAFGVGLRGMGGECLCQTYLAVMHEHLRAHPYVRAHEDRIDWEFWTIHTGEIDIEHGEMTRAAVDDYLRQQPDALQELAQGYAHSIDAWNAFWRNIFDAQAAHRALS
jgi:hypothetical protein